MVQKWLKKVIKNGKKSLFFSEIKTNQNYSFFPKNKKVKKTRYVRPKYKNNINTNKTSKKGPKNGSKKGSKNDPKSVILPLLGPHFWPKILVIYAKNHVQKVVQKSDQKTQLFVHFFDKKLMSFFLTKIDKNYLFFYKKPEIPSDSSANPKIGGFGEDPFFDPKIGHFILESSMYIAFCTSILGTKKWKTSEYRYFWQKWYLLARIVKKWVQKWGHKISLFDQKYHFFTHMFKYCTSVC